MAVITRETSSRKAMVRTSPNEKRRALSRVQMPDLEGVAFTSQMMLKDFCNWTNTPVAPTRMVIIPIILVQMEWVMPPAFLIISCTWTIMFRITNVLVGASGMVIIPIILVQMEWVMPPAFLIISCTWTR